jgi:hypothetical protein
LSLSTNALSSRPFEASAATVEKGIAEPTNDATIAMDEAAEITFFICNNSFLLGF